MTKAEIVNIIAKGTGLTKIESGAVVDGFLATIGYALQSGEHVELRGFGTFCLRERQEKHVANPRTGKMMHIPHRVVPDFKPSPQLKAYVLEGLKKSGKFVSKTVTEKQTDILSELDNLNIDE